MTKYKQDKIQYQCEWFTAWIRKTLGEKRITVEKLSEMTGIGKTTIMYYLGGVRSPNLKTFLLIAEKLDYDVQIVKKHSTECR